MNGWRRSSKPCGACGANFAVVVTLIGFAGAPWTVAAYMVEGRGGTDFAEAKRMARQQPELFATLIDLLVEQTIAYLSAQIMAGAETCAALRQLGGRS